MKDKGEVESQLEQYKLERKRQFEAEKNAEQELIRMVGEEALAAEAEAEEERSRTARIQFRLPDGSSETHHFSSGTSLGELFEFVRSNWSRKLPYTSFSLSTSHPRRNLDTLGMELSLQELELTSATVLVLPIPSSLDISSQDSGLLSMVQLMITPITILWTMVKGYRRLPGEEEDRSSLEMNTDRVRIHIGPKRRRDPGCLEMTMFYCCFILVVTLIVRAMRYIPTLPYGWYHNF